MFGNQKDYASALVYWFRRLLLYQCSSLWGIVLGCGVVMRAFGCQLVCLGGKFLLKAVISLIDMYRWRK